MKCFFLAALLLPVIAFGKEGRFQLLRINESPNSIHMIDTQSGQIWRPTCFTESTDKECAIKAWQKQNVIGINISEKEIYKTVNEYEKQRAEGTLSKAGEAESSRKPASVAGEKEEYQQVKGYIRSDGTYVAPYIRTSPNSTTFDNIRPKK